MSSSASRLLSVLGGQALPWSDFFVIVSLTSYCCIVYVVQGNSKSNHCLFSELPSVSVRVRHTRAAAAAHLLEFKASGRGARESVCAGHINQLQRCLFDPRIACLENTDVTEKLGLL